MSVSTRPDPDLPLLSDESLPPEGDGCWSAPPADAPPSIPGLLMDETAPLELVPTEEFPATAGFDTILPIPAAPAPVLG